MPFPCFKSWKDWPATSSQCPPSVPWYLDLFRPWYLARKSVTEVHFRNTCDRLSFISSYHLCNVYHSTFSSDLFITYYRLRSPQLTDWLTDFLSMLSQPCFLHLLCNVHHLTSSFDLFNPCFWLAPLHVFLLHVHTISALLPSPSLQCLPLHIFSRSLHSKLSSSVSPYLYLRLSFISSLYITLASFIFSTMSTTPHFLLTSSLHIILTYRFLSPQFLSLSL